MLKKMQSLRPVHEPWFEFDLVDGDAFSWTPPRTNRYTGVSGGADWGPTSQMLQASLWWRLAHNVSLNLYC